MPCWAVRVISRGSIRQGRNCQGSYVCSNRGRSGGRGADRPGASSATARIQCKYTRSASWPTSTNLGQPNPRGHSSWRRGDAKPLWSAKPAMTTSTTGNTPCDSPHRITGEPRASKDARGVRRETARKRTCTTRRHLAARSTQSPAWIDPDRHPRRRPLSHLIPA
jgi:hypothetical protein